MTAERSKPIIPPPDPVRLAAARLTPRSFEPNCISTAFFISHVKDDDRFVQVFEAHKFLKEMRRLDSPAVNCFVAWLREADVEVLRRVDGTPLEYIDLQKEGFQAGSDSIKMTAVDHLAVAVSLDPLLVTYRGGLFGKVRRNVPFEEANSYFPGCRIEYYVPLRNRDLSEDSIAARAYYKYAQLRDRTHRK